MKKLMAFLLAAVMLLSLAACKPPVDGPDMENPNPPTETPVDTPSDGPEDPGVPADPDPFETIDNPEATMTEDPLNLMIYEGRYVMEPMEGYEASHHVLDVVSYGHFLTLEHSLYEDGTVYAYWVEEFWPNEDETFTDLYDAMEGKYQSFSVQVADTQYDYCPQYAAFLYNDSGIAISRGEEWPREYYILDSEQPAPHSTTEALAQELQVIDSHTTGVGPLGGWYYWDGYRYTMINFCRDGSLFWINKTAGVPVEIYKGAWGINEIGKVTILAERLGCSRMPFFAQLDYTYDAEYPALTLTENEGTLLQGYDGAADLFPYTPEIQIQFGQKDGLAYVTEVWGIEDTYQAADGQEYYYDFCLPHMPGDGYAISSINEDINAQFGSLIAQAFADMDAGNPLTCQSTYWQTFFMGDVLAIDVHAYGEQDHHMVYYYDTATGSRLYARDVFTMLGLDEQTYLEGLMEEALKAFDMHHYDITEEEMDSDAYWSCLYWTISTDNINLDRPFYINDFGEIVTYVQVETLYGTYWELVYPFGMMEPDSVG